MPPFPIGLDLFNHFAKSCLPWDAPDRNFLWFVLIIFQYPHLRWLIFLLFLPLILQIHASSDAFFPTLKLLPSSSQKTLLAPLFQDHILIYRNQRYTYCLSVSQIYLYTHALLAKSIYCTTNFCFC